MSLLDRPLHIEVSDSLLRDVTAVRRDIHAHPELGFQETRTAQLVADRLRELGYEVQTGIGKTGVRGVLRSGRPGKTILLRADMDALPIQEDSGVGFSSQQSGVMHACGHDGHVAMLLGASEWIARQRERLSGTIVLCFQPAEEGLGGARAMIQDGILEDPHVDAVYGLHLWSRLRSGVVATRPGPVMAASDSIDVTVHGRGGHGAAPHETIDPVIVASNFVTSVQHVVSRSVDPLQPAVISIGSIHGGTTHNVIPDDVRMLGTVRTFDAGVRERMPVKIEQVLRGCCDAAGAHYDFEYEWRYPVTINEPSQTRFVRDVAARVVGEGNATELAPVMGAEDFSFMLEARPGCFFFVGAQRPGSDVNHHSPRFVIDEGALEIGVKMMAALAQEAPTAAPG